MIFPALATLLAQFGSVALLTSLSVASAQLQPIVFMPGELGSFENATGSWEAYDPPTKLVECFGVTADVQGCIGSLSYDLSEQIVLSTSLQAPEGYVIEVYPQNGTSDNGLPIEFNFIARRESVERDQNCGTTQVIQSTNITTKIIGSSIDNLIFSPDYSTNKVATVEIDACQIRMRNIMFSGPFETFQFKSIWWYVPFESSLTPKGQQTYSYNTSTTSMTNWDKSSSFRLVRSPSSVPTSAPTSGTVLKGPSGMPTMILFGVAGLFL